MTKNDNDKIKDAMQDTAFLNLYPFGINPYWTAHTSRTLAENAATLRRTADGVYAVQVALPVHKGWFNEMPERKCKTTERARRNINRIVNGEFD